MPTLHCQGTVTSPQTPTVREAVAAALFCIVCHCWSQ